MEQRRQATQDILAGSWWHIVAYILLGCAVLMAAFVVETLMHYPGSGTPGF